MSKQQAKGASISSKPSQSKGWPSTSSKKFKDQSIRGRGASQGGRGRDRQGFKTGNSERYVNNFRGDREDRGDRQGRRGRRERGGFKGIGRDREGGNSNGSKESQQRRPDGNRQKKPMKVWNKGFSTSSHQGRDSVVGAKRQDAESKNQRKDFSDRNTSMRYQKGYNSKNSTGSVIENNQNVIAKSTDISTAPALNATDENKNSNNINDNKKPNNKRGNTDENPSFKTKPIKKDFKKPFAIDGVPAHKKHFSIKANQVVTIVKQQSSKKQLKQQKKAAKGIKIQFKQQQHQQEKEVHENTSKMDIQNANNDDDDNEQIQIVKGDEHQKDLKNLSDKQKKGKALIKHNRIIIRNLVFDINQKHLKKLFAPFGQIKQINIPKNPDNGGSRGFAFIQFQNRNHCLKAIKRLNGTTFKGRVIILDESVSKQRYVESRLNEDQKAKEMNNQEKIQQQESDDKDIKKENAQEDQSEEEEQEDDQELSSDNDAQEMQHVKQQKSTMSAKGAKKQPENLNETIFIRNLPISVTEEDLHKFFRKYGKLKFAKVVLNKETNTSRGTGFVKFTEAVKAQELIDYSRDYEMNLLGKNPNFKINPAINLELEGIVLKIFPVETRDGVSDKIKGRDNKQKQRAEAAQKKKKPLKKVKNLEKLAAYDPNNKRNLKLALLGLNKPAEDMRQQDIERFRNHEKEKLEKLKNPNNSVSDKRIIFKYLRKDITERQIQELCNSYLKSSNHKEKDLTYCKLMLESLQSKKSAGFAFVEFKRAQISLGFLNWISQNPKQLMKQPFVCQFAIQNSKKLVGKLKKGIKGN